MYKGTEFDVGEVVRFAVLGPVRAWRGGVELDLGTPQQRALLAALLLREGAQASMGELSEALWGGAEPDASAAVVRMYVARLRRALDESGVGPRGSLISTLGGGYALAADAGCLDLAVFRRTVADAERARRAGDLAEAVACLRAALALWRGEALAGIPGEFAAAERARLELLRLGTVTVRLELELDLGAHAALVPELGHLASRNPFDERLRGLQMLALYRSGHQAHALAAYREVQTRLADELGVDPGPALQRLHERILRADAALLLTPHALPDGGSHTESAAQSPPARSPSGEDVRSPVPRPGRAPDEDVAIMHAADRDSTLGGRLRAARMRSFVGRDAERAMFRLALDGGDDALSVLYVHGPGGSGKTALLRVLAEDARTAGRHVVEIDTRVTDPTPPAFEAAAASLLTTDGAVLVIDTFEFGHALEGWLRLKFLPRLPYDAVIVIAGRLPPDSGWRTDPDWKEALRVITLPDLSDADARALLSARGVPTELHERVLAFAGGQPLALTLAADLAARYESAPGDWVPDQAVVKSLLTRLVGAVPSAEHRRALEVCAHVEVTTVELLRVTIGDRAHELFEWLRELPFIDSGRHGLAPHDVVRESLIQDLRWRDPDGFVALHRGIRDHLLAKVRAASGPEVMERARSMSFLYRRSSASADYMIWAERGAVYEDPYQPADRAAVLELAEEAEGPESAALADFWLDRQPENFLVYRKAVTDEVLGFTTWLRLTTPDALERDTDPVIAAAWQHASATNPPREGEHIAVHRWNVDPKTRTHKSPLIDLILLRATAEWLRANGLAWSFITVLYPHAWHDQVTAVDHYPVGEPMRIGKRTAINYAHDWRMFPLSNWLHRRDVDVLTGRRPPQQLPTRQPMPRGTFDMKVRAALRDLADSSLRDRIDDAVRRLADDPRADKQYRAVRTTYFERVPTQEAAAQRLGLPFSTYRRHLTAGVQRICDYLWEQELSTD